MSQLQKNKINFEVQNKNYKALVSMCQHSHLCTAQKRKNNTYKAMGQSTMLDNKYALQLDTYNKNLLS